MSSDDGVQQTYLLITLEIGRLKVNINLGEGSKVTFAGNTLNDDKWHSLLIQRRGPSMEIKLDDEYQITEISGQLIDLHYNYISIGTLVVSKPIVQSRHRIDPAFRDIPNFIGSIQNFILNENDFIDLSKHESSSSLNFTITANYGKKDGTFYRPFNFKSKNTYIGLPQLKAYSSMNLYFLFHTNHANGLILFNGGKDDDFIAIELVNGFIHYTFSIGNAKRRLKSSNKLSLNDVQWHSVFISRSNIGKHTMIIDDSWTSVLDTESSLNLNLDGLLYLGGVPKQLYTQFPTIIQSTHGYEGCLASLEFNGETIDPIGIDALVPSTLVSSGCPGWTLNSQHHHPLQIGSNQPSHLTTIISANSVNNYTGNLIKNLPNHTMVNGYESMCSSKDNCYCDDGSNIDNCLRALGKRFMRTLLSYYYI